MVSSAGLGCAVKRWFSLNMTKDFQIILPKGVKILLRFSSTIV